MQAIVDPAAELLQRASSAMPWSPFAGPRYAAAMRALGARPVVFMDGAGPAAGVLQSGFLRGPASRQWLELPSTQETPNAAGFWREMEAWCRRSRVRMVDISSFASARLAPEDLPLGIPVSHRAEWVIRFSPESRQSATSSNHRRNAGKARKRGVSVAPAESLAGLATHIALMEASFDRRRSRGESVHHDHEMLQKELSALLEHGGGRLWQATLEGRVVSSLLVIEGEQVDYYQSAGTAPEGMECGAAVLVVETAIEAARNAGRAAFNLAGAGDENPGLQRFKAGFGAERVNLVAGEWDLRSPLYRFLRDMLRRTRHRLTRPPGND